MIKKRVLTGITTTGSPHLGNYVGAIKKAIILSEAKGQDSFYFLADYHALVKNKDPKEIVVDEEVGQSIPIYLYEIAHGTIKNSQEALFFYIYIFILFRFFDIKKPFPVSYFDKKFKNSLGVILDDIIAGLYVMLTLIIFMIIKSKLFT